MSNDDDRPTAQEELGGLTVDRDTGEVLAVDDRPSSTSFVGVVDRTDPAVLDEATAQLQKVAAAVMATEKKGTVTLTVTVTKPEHGQHLYLTAATVAKVPKHDPEPEAWFVAPEGKLTRHDPNQMSLIMHGDT